jgi:hypothetical protein
MQADPETRVRWRRDKRTGPCGGDYATLQPLANARLGLFDIKRNTIIAGMNKEAAATWSNIVAIESVSGKILLREMSYNEAEKKLDTNDVGTVELPVVSISGMRASEVSDDFGWMVMSSKTRGGIWNLSTGERTMFTPRLQCGHRRRVGHRWWRTSRNWRRTNMRSR